MLVKSIKAFDDYSGTREIPAGKIFIVFAIERNGDRTSYSVLPYGKHLIDGEYDPLYFNSDIFEIVADKVTKDWVTKEMPIARGVEQLSSFPEWFVDNFYIRAHDWNLQGDDYQVIRKYKDKYEELYQDKASQ